LKLICTRLRSPQLLQYTIQDKSAEMKLYLKILYEEMSAISKQDKSAGTKLLYQSIGLTTFELTIPEITTYI
jgi:hypothetical protein